MICFFTFLSCHNIYHQTNIILLFKWLNICSTLIQYDTYKLQYICWVNLTSFLVIFLHFLDLRDTNMDMDSACLRMHTHIYTYKQMHYLDMFHTRMVFFKPSSFQYIIQPSTRPCCIPNSCRSPRKTFYWFHLKDLQQSLHCLKFSNLNQVSEATLVLGTWEFHCFQGNI